MKKLLPILLLANSLCYSQSSTFLSVVDGNSSNVTIPYWPTNVPSGTGNISALIWYEPSIAYGTNGVELTMSNLVSQVTNAWNLTRNISDITKWPTIIPSSLNNLDTLSFVTDDSMATSTSVDLLGVWEFFFVLSITNIAANNYVIGTQTGTGYTFGIIANKFIINCGSVANVSIAVTNRWCVANALINGASSTIRTNNVQGATANAGFTTGDGLRLSGTGSGVSWPSDMKIATVFGFQGVLSATARSNAFWYCTNRFALTL